MNRLLNSPQLNRLRDFMMTGKYMMLLFAVGAVFAAFEWNVAGVLVFACIISATLVICEDLLATFMPFMITCLIAAKCYNSYSTFIQYKSLGVIIALCLIAHFVLYWKKPDTKGALTKPMIFVSIAVVLGGVGFISKEEYFSPVSLVYILTLGFAMVVLYWMFYTYLTVRRDYSLIEKVTLIMVIAGCFASFVTIAFYMMNIDEVIETRDLLYMQWRNNYSTFLMLSIPFAFLRGHKKPYSIMLGFFFYFCILLTGSRGGLVFGAVEMAMCCLLFILYDKRRRLTYIAICACLAFALLIFSREFFSFFGSTFDRLLSAINGVLIGEQQEVRYYQYIRGIQDFLNNPILGTGIGYMGNRDVYAGADFSIAWYHCELIQIPASFGIVGIAAYAYQFIKRNILLWKKPTMFNMTVFLSYISLELMSLVNPGIFSPIPYLLIVTMFFAIVERCNVGTVQKIISTKSSDKSEEDDELEGTALPEATDTTSEAQPSKATEKKDAETEPEKVSVGAPKDADE